MTAQVKEEPETEVFDNNNMKRVSLSEVEMRETEKKAQEDVITWKHFIDNTTVHGVRHVFNDDKRVRLRRWCWLLAVVGSLSAFLVGVGLRAGDFFQYRSNVNVQVIYTRNVRFPAVTVCNQNSFRITRAVDAGLYQFLDGIFEASNQSGHLDALEKARGVPSYNGTETQQFLMEAAHRIEDMLHSCSWDRQHCDTSDFNVTLTDFGVCFTFNSKHRRPVLQSSTSGSRSSLSLVFNVEQYEYMKGPHTDAGIMLLLHDQGDFPLVGDLGFAVSPGTHTLIGVKQYEIHHLEVPYGDCDRRAEQYSHCLVRCKGRRMAQQCGCVALHVPQVMAQGHEAQGMARGAEADWGRELGAHANWTGQGGTERQEKQSGHQVCDAASLFTCVLNVSDTFHPDFESCGCAIPCKRVMYEASLSYTQLSAINSGQMTATGPLSSNSLVTNFLRAREYSQRHVKELHQLNDHHIQAVNSTLTAIVQIFSRLNATLTEGSDSIKDQVIRIEEGFKKDIKLVTNFGDKSPFGGHVGMSKSVSPWRTFDTVLSDMMTIFLESYIENSYYSIRNRTHSYLTVWLDACREESHLEDSWFTTNESVYDAYPCKDFTEYYPSYGTGNSRSVSNIKRTPDKVECKQLLLTKRSCAIELQKNVTEFVSRYGERIQKYEDEVEKAFTEGPGNKTAFGEVATPCREYYAYPDGQVISKLRNLEQQVQLYLNATNITEAIEYSVGLTRALNGTSMMKKLHDGRLSSFVDVYNTACWLRPILDSFHFNKRTLERDYVKQEEALLVAFYGQYSHTVARHSYLKTTFDQMEKEYGILDRYQSENITTLEMAQALSSPSSSRAFDRLLVAVSDLNDELAGVSHLLNELRDSINDTFTFILYQSTLPLVKYSVMQNLSVVEVLGNSVRSDWKQADGCCGPVDIIHIIRDGFAHKVEALWSLKEEMAVRTSSLEMAIEDLKELLVEYKKSTKINAQFVKENMVQLDIFYKEVGYEEIDQQPAFGALSLAGEIGGFLGLLLGASVLTVIELFDFLILRCIHKCKRTKVKR